MSRLVVCLVLAACNAAPTAPAAPSGPTLPATLYVHASSANLREMPEEKAPVVEKLPIGAPLLVSDLGPVWARASAASGSGFIAREMLGAEKPTLEWAIAKHDALPLDDVAGRRSWAERGAALAPEDVGALERLIAALDRAADKKALERVKKGLAGVREALQKEALAGVVVQPEAAARALPNVDSDLVQSFAAGDLVAVLRDSHSEGGQVFVAVVAKGRRAWMQLTALLVPEIHHLYDNYIEGTASEGEAWNAAPQAQVLWRNEIMDRIAAASDVQLRRRTVAAIFGRVTGELGAMTGNWSSCQTVADLWITFHKDADAEVRQAANAGVLYMREDFRACVIAMPQWREALRKRLMKLPPKVSPEEREQLGALLETVAGQGIDMGISAP